MQIRNRFNGNVIIEGDYKSTKDALEKNTGADLSEANLSGANLSGANLSEADLYGANLYRADLSRANLSGANLYRADLSRANLYEAALSEADLSVANLYEANLSGANLSVANLSGADLSEVFIYIKGSKHDVQYLSYFGQLRIGCRCYHLEYWLIMYDTIGKEEGYTEQEIKEYHNYMKMLKQL